MMRPSGFIDRTVMSDGTESISLRELLLRYEISREPKSRGERVYDRNRLGRFRVIGVGWRRAHR